MDFGDSVDVAKPTDIVTEPFDKQRAEHRLKSEFTKSILMLFGIGNSVVFLILAVLIVRDWIFLERGLIDVGQQAVNENVLMTLIGATTVQVGTVVLTITKRLFN